MISFVIWRESSVISLLPRTCPGKVSIPASAGIDVKCQNPKHRNQSEITVRPAGKERLCRAIMRARHTPARTDLPVSHVYGEEEWGSIGGYGSRRKLVHLVLSVHQ